MPVGKPYNTKLDLADKKSCFARGNEHKCNALNEKHCKGCSFYKHRNEIKNNPFYAYSYRSLKKHDEDMKKHRINPDDVIY